MRQAEPRLQRRAVLGSHVHSRRRVLAIERRRGSRVLDDSYGANFPALVVPKGKTERLAYVSAFVEQAKASGLVQRAIDRAGQAGYRVAAPAT